MQRKHIILIALVVGIPGIAGLYWWLFGWTTNDHDVFGYETYYRSFGRYTRVEIDCDRDGRPELKMIHPFSEPFIGNFNAPCSYPNMSFVADTDFDGDWDTWVEPESCDPDSGFVTVVRVDTDGDGAQDFESHGTRRDAWDHIDTYIRDQGRTDMPWPDDALR